MCSIFTYKMVTCKMVGCSNLKEFSDRQTLTFTTSVLGQLCNEKTCIYFLLLILFHFFVQEFLLFFFFLTFSKIVLYELFIYK